MTKLWAVRIFRARDTCKRNASVVMTKRFTVDGWDARITIGDISDEVVRATAVGDAAIGSLLDEYLVPKGADRLAARDAHIIEQAAKFQLPQEWAQQDGLYTTLTVLRSVEVEAADSERASSMHFWFDLNSALRVAGEVRQGRDDLLERHTGPEHDLSRRS
ncbi:hypothetical protein [Streptosporangium sp. NPDC000509]|uniref:hypothetical protein n=1 Tax=Streptosporangium sp. NPDC000509 TaxID=3366186 RepID=UPI0036C92E8C